jgi:hypothetical protein
MARENFTWGQGRIIHEAAAGPNAVRFVPKENYA